MRADMKQVLIERPRSGWRKKHQRTNKPRVTDWNGTDVDVERAPPRPPKTKYFDDLLGPLRKYLRRQVGRPWNKVHSEICAGIDRRSVTGRHLMEHVFREVSTDCVLDANGKPAKGIHDYRHRDRPLEGLYVHPRTGLLRWIEPDTKREWREYWNRRHLVETPHLRSFGAGHFALCRAGIWYAVIADRLSYPLPQGESADFEYRRHEPFRIRSMHQMTTRELRDHNLANEPPED